LCRIRHAFACQSALRLVSDVSLMNAQIVGTRVFKPNRTQKGRAQARKALLIQAGVFRNADEKLTKSGRDTRRNCPINPSNR
jgi:hypothetical protein